MSTPPIDATSQFDNVNLKKVTGKYFINNVPVLTNATLGTSITSSNLTKVGMLSNLDITGDLKVKYGAALRVDSVNNLVGIKNQSPIYPLDVGGSINTAGSYKINGNDVLTATTLGDEIINSNLQKVGTLNQYLNVAGNVNISGPRTYKINGIDVLSATSLGPNVISSNLNTVGTLNSLNVTGNTNLGPSSSYRIGGNSVLSASTLGSGVINSSLQTVGTLNQNLSVSGNADITGEYRINGTSVLSRNTLRPGIKFSSLETLGTLQNLSVISDVNTNSSYKINGAVVLNSTSLGDSIKLSKLTNVGRLNGLEVNGSVSASSYSIFDNSNNKIDILSYDTLASTVKFSSLRVLGKLLSLTSQGSINTDDKYRIKDVEVLTENKLGDGILFSSLQRVGTLSSLTVSGTIDADSNKVISSYIPNADNVLTNKKYVDGEIGKKLSLLGGLMAGAIDMGSNKITSSYIPVADVDLVNKSYVENRISSEVNTTRFQDVFSFPINSSVYNISATNRNINITNINVNVVCLPTLLINGSIFHISNSTNGDVVIKTNNSNDRIFHYILTPQQRPQQTDFDSFGTTQIELPPYLTYKLIYFKLTDGKGKWNIIG